jgi:hypothetical protein
MTLEEILKDFDIPELIKIGAILKDMKSSGSSELNIIIRDSVVVNVRRTDLWVKQNNGTPFESCIL